MTTKIESPHDRFFKETMGKIEVVESFLEYFLPEDIKNIVDFGTLKPEKDTFIDEEMRTSYSDLLLNVHINDKDGYLYFLFEHKSYYSKTTAHQLLKYMTAIWDGKIHKGKKEELPAIIPIVFYQGSNDWKVGTSLGYLIGGYKQLPNKVKNYIPNFEYLLYNVANHSDVEIIGNAYLQAYLSIIRNTHKSFKEFMIVLMKVIEYLKELDNQEDALGYFQTMFRYVYSVREAMTKKEHEKIIKEIESAYPEGSESVMTIAEMLRKEGLDRGRAEGKEEGKIETVLKALKVGLSTDTIIEITGLSKDEIKKIADS